MFSGVNAAIAPLRKHIEYVAESNSGVFIRVSTALICG